MSAAGSHREPERQAPLRRDAVRDDRRSIRSHHRRAVVRTGSALEEAAASISRRRQPATAALDLATGTGDIAFAFATRGATRGRPRHHASHDRAGEAQDAGRHAAAFLVGDMLALPFPDGSFDIVTTGYGLRNVPDLDARDRRDPAVLKPGGQALSLDFDRPANACRARRLLCVSHGRRWRPRLAAAPRSGHLSLHSGFDSQLSGGRPGRPA